MFRDPATGKFRWQSPAVIAIVVALGFGARGCLERGSKKSADTYRKASLSRQQLRVTKTATGEVIPQNRVEIKAPIAGRIEEVLVREGDAVTQGQVLAWMSSSERAALLDAARSQGTESLTRWESAYKAAPLMAPLDGTVIVRAVEPGQTVTTTDPVVVIADRLIVKAQVDETDVGSINVGQTASISPDAFSQETIAAHVDHVAYEAKTVNNVTIYEVDVLPDSVPDFMRSGMTATVTFTVSEKADALAVPAEAVAYDRKAASVLVPNPKLWQPPIRVNVQTGLNDGKLIEILSGLKEGDTVLVPSLKLPRSKNGQGRNPFSPFGSASSRGSDRNRTRQ